MATTLSNGHRHDVVAAATVLTPNTLVTSAVFKIPPNSSGEIIVGINVTTSGAIDVTRDKIQVYGHVTDDGSDAGFPLNVDIGSDVAYNLLQNSNGLTACIRSASLKWYPCIKVRHVGTGAIAITHAEPMVIVSQSR